MPKHIRQIPTSTKNTRAARSAHAKASKQFIKYDTSAIRPKRSIIPAIVAGLVVVAIIVVAIVWIFSMLGCSGDNIGSLSQSETAKITVTSGESARDVAAEFEKCGLIKSADAFLKDMSSAGVDKSIQAGTYSFSGKTRIADLIAILKSGPNANRTVTVVEGFRLDEIASAVQTSSEGKISAEAFNSACSNAESFADEYSFLKEAGTNSLEGFLLPKTYNIEDGDDATTLIKKMLSQFQTETSGLSMAYLDKQGLSFYDAIKLASIVQKESPADLHARVASVFYNRLSSDQPYLQSDATTAYEVRHDPTADEVHANTPYSTYANAGLPPTPICCPSIDSIKAVLAPEETDYMYFYTDSSGNFSFSETYDEHLSAIENDK